MRSTDTTTASPAPSHKLKSMFKKHNEKSSEIAIVDSNSSDEILPVPSPINRERRISTIAENVGEYSDDTDSVSGSDDDSDTTSSCSDSSSDDDDSSDDDLDEHIHEIRKVVFPLQTSELHSRFLKWNVGFSLANSHQLKQQANEELKATFSLLDAENKIHQLSCHFNNYDSVIMDNQVKLMDNLTVKLNKIVINHQYDLMQGKTLYDRYGVITNVIGRGSYGMIKIIKPELALDVDAEHLKNRKFYAVKEILKRKDEGDKTFIDRVISEFIIASTLNNKHIVKTVDLMLTVPENVESDAKFCQVMECTTGGDLFTYMTTCINKKNEPITYMSVDEIDCFVKQIAKGLYYMHQHGVAHCDLKLENILVNYKFGNDSNRSGHASTILKIGDFGKANVLRTKWEANELYLPSNLGPIGSEPYMAPEEHTIDPEYSYSLNKKDNWSLGIVILLLFMIRKHYYSGTEKSCDSEGRFSTSYCEDAGYPWYTTAFKVHSSHKRYKDKLFFEFTKSCMLADYNDKTKEWLVKRQGSYRLVERLFVENDCNDDDDDDNNDIQPKDEIDDLSELRRMIIYKLLDLNPQSRMTTLQLLKSDWMTAVDSCT